MKMLADFVMIQPETRHERKVGQILLPDNSAEAKMFCRGTVRAVGEGLYLSNGTQIPPSIGPGDKVLYFKDQALDISVKNENMHVLREGRIIGVFEPGDADAPGVGGKGFVLAAHHEAELNERGV